MAYPFTHGGFMKSLVVGLLLLTISASAYPQSTVDHLSPSEIGAAVASKADTGYVKFEDQGFSTPANCTTQMPSESIFTPTGLLHALSDNAKGQYLPFNPSDEDTLRALTVISVGCVNGTPSGPSCTSITRVAILSDIGGRVVVEAIASHSRPATWQNGFGATAACSDLVSKFAMADVARARNAKGEFIIATFDGATLLKAYTVKQKHIKKLGM
jgi:hypothetical protein